MDNNITNTHFIDANRQNSKEVDNLSSDNNPAQWTNVISTGLKLNEGDKVSVAYSCVNEIGCGNQALETTGKPLKQSVDYEHTERTHVRADSISDTEYNIELGPYGSLSTSANNITTTITPKDNDFNIVVSYYKTTNGENYIHLPRCYDTGIDPLAQAIPYNELGSANSEGPTGWQTRNAERQKLWYASDDAHNGRPWTNPAYRCWADWHWYAGNRHYMPISATQYGMTGHDHPRPVRTAQYYDINDWKKRNDNTRYTLYQSAYTIYNKDGLSASGTEWDVLFGQRDPALQHFRKYKELKQYSISAGFNDPHNVAYQLTSQITDPKLGPQPVSTHQVGFEQSTLLKTTAVPDYDTEITMSAEGEVYKPFACANWKTMKYGTGEITAGTANAKTHTLGAWSNFYNGKDMDEQTADTSDSDDEQYEQRENKKQDILDYASSYNIIGIKRPEIYDAGMKFNTAWATALLPDTINQIGEELGSVAGEILQSSLGGLNSDLFLNPALEPNVDGAGNTGAIGGLTNKSGWLVTDIFWYDQGGLGPNLDGSKTTSILDAMRDLFKAQRLYPETLQFPKRDETTYQNENTIYRMDTPPLQPTLDYYPTAQSDGVSGIDSPFKKRYLHMNRETNTARGDRGLGDDNCAWADYALGYSQPLWFYYDEDLADVYNDKPTYSDVAEVPAGFDGTNLSSQDLCYGFAMKYRKGETDYVALNIQGLPTQYVADDAYWLGDRTNNVSSIGYDLHFNAYGTSNIVLYSGIMPCNAQGDTCVGVNKQGEEITDGGYDGQGGPTQGPPAVGFKTGRDMPPEGYGISALIRQVYIGAIDPIIQFLDSNSRFTIGNLHTPEYQQNPAQAGKPVQDTDPQAYIPTLADEGTEVYKVNKKLTMWNNYTPDMVPYRSEESYKAPAYAFGSAFHTVIGTGAVEGTKHWVVPCEVSGNIVRATIDGNMGYVAGGWSQATPNLGSPTGYAHSTVLAGYGGIAEGHGSRRVDVPHEYLETNYNLDRFVVYDAHSGIYLEDFGITDRNDWSNSLFGIMGFDFDSFNPTTALQLNRQTRLTRVNFNQMKPLTTCADIPMKDTPTAVKNLWQKTLYTCQMPVPLLTNLWYGYMCDLWYNADGVGTGTNPKHNGWTGGSPDYGRERHIFQVGDQNQPQIYPMIQNPQTSNTVMALGLPIKMKSPYYLIKSDIIADSYYLRNKTPLPIVAVVNKENGFGDFYFSQASQQTFTVTQPTTLTEIRTEIYDADMTLARCDANSGVIYKIEKAIPTNPNLVQELLKTNKEGQLEPKKNVISNYSPSRN